MAKETESRQLLYAITSGYTRQDSDAAGIGVIIKAARHHTLRKISSIVSTTDPVMAAYDAIIVALREARQMGARVLIVYTDCEAVIKQLERTVRVAPDQLARHLEARSLLNQFHRAEIVRVSPGQNEAARVLAMEALERHEGAGGARQLELPLINSRAS